MTAQPRMTKDRRSTLKKYHSMCTGDQPCEAAEFLAELNEVEKELEVSAQNYQKLVQERDRDREELSMIRRKLESYAPVREFYGPAGIKAVSEVIKERDKARAALSTYMYEANIHVRQLEKEIEILRQFGNKDCTAMADEALVNEREK